MVRGSYKSSTGLIPLQLEDLHKSKYYIKSLARFSTHGLEGVNSLLEIEIMENGSNKAQLISNIAGTQIRKMKEDLNKTNVAKDSSSYK